MSIRKTNRAQLCCSGGQNEKPGRIEGGVWSQDSSQVNHVNKCCCRGEEQKMELSPSKRECLLIKLLQQGNSTQDGPLLLADSRNVRQHLKRFKPFLSSPAIKWCHQPPMQEELVMRSPEVCQPHQTCMEALLLTLHLQSVSGSKQHVYSRLKRSCDSKLICWS